MQLVSTAFIVTVQKYDFRSHFVLRPGVQVFHPCEADKMLLKPLPRLGAHPLLFGANRQPAVIAHPFKDRSSGEKTIALGNVCNGLRSEDTRGDALQLFVVESDRLCARIRFEYLI